ncbi:DEAD/DEAH box helicase [Colwellia echini]|uniref:DEAD/DEAH box helicase n=1 Tax=Colwellia echini TaxID=1982103 RepID=A0ABY3N0Q4_9GAMM|nr:DEAD/DEAH box helicase family protein [Colwellia echini]TYK66822.1 DEAD/DEAH box helicase [Colwellia echini]
MKLRNWQSECINSAISKYNFKKHFLTLATPGAGKTLMASVLAKKLHEQGLIDLVMCFSPSSVVSSDFSDSLVDQFGTHFDGTLGALGDSFTYQKLSSIGEKTWRLFEQYRVFVIFDEIHHCAGSSEYDANSWGSPIINRIQDKAAYTIALTGTPWRSDSLPIALSEYCKKSGQVICDYIYGLKQAILDDVCRVPQIVAIDNDKITVTKNDEKHNFISFLDVLSQNIISYSQIVKHQLVIEQVLYRAINKLNEIRGINTKAGGLVVASSIEHARTIKQIMKSLFNTEAIIVTSNEKKPNTIIKQFRKSHDKWLISVGMVSEGTNIPRLQVCCNLTNVKTEMYFRQILGRILRKTNERNQEAYMFIPAEPNLLEFTSRVAQDIPDGLSAVTIINMDEELQTEIVDVDGDEELTSNMDIVDDCGSIELKLLEQLKTDNDEQGFPAIGQGDLDENIRLIDIEGRFKHKQLKIEDIDMFQISTCTMNRLNSMNLINI